MTHEKKKEYLVLSSFCFLLGGLLLSEKKVLAYPYYYYLKWAYRKVLKWLPYIKEVSKKYNIDPALVSAIIYQESKGNPYAISPSGAIGLMQIMPSTGLKVCGYTSDKLFNPYYNIECGTKYLAELYKKTRNYAFAVAKYYGGPKATPWSTFGSPPVYEYVKNVMIHFENFKKLV